MLFSYLLLELLGNSFLGSILNLKIPGTKIIELNQIFIHGASKAVQIQRIQIRMSQGILNKTQFEIVLCVNQKPKIMKKTIIALTLTVVVVIFTVTVGIAQSNDQYKVQIEKINKESVAAMLAGNTEKSLSFYADDAISLPNYDKMLEGKDAIRKSNEAMIKAGSKITSFEPVTLKVISCE